MGDEGGSGGVGPASAAPGTPGGSGTRGFAAGGAAGAGPQTAGPRLPRLPQKEYQQVALPTPEQLVAMQFWDHCAAKTVVSGVMGGIMGLIMGPVFGSFDAAAMPGAPSGTEEARKAAQAELKRMDAPFRQQMAEMMQWKNIKAGAKRMGARSVSYGKTFGLIGALFSGAECVVEKYRAKHDIFNGVAAGCFAGAALAVETGPVGMCTGCAGFAAFSAVIDKIMDH